MRRILTLLGVACLVTGCMPGVYVTKDPGDHNRGIRYYRPKPYLLIEPSTKSTVIDKATTTEIDPQGKLYKITLQYLPDFNEEYAARVRTGFGSAKVAMELQDGWNLTSLNQELDSQTDENVEALASLVSAVPGLMPPGALAESRSPQNLQSVTVRGSKIPIGYYESVIGRDPHGRKQLYGFRYVGFLPYASCPVEPGGLQQGCCEDGSLELYGLIFDHEADMMVFQRVGETACEYHTAKVPAPTASLNLSPQFAPVESIDTVPPPVLPAAPVETPTLQIPTTPPTSPPGQ